jgi:hypothetical protein
MEKIGRLETFAKAGFFARGILYILLGYFAVVTGGGEGAAGVLQRIKDAPAGSALLLVMCLGLVGYGIYRLFSAWLNLDGKKDNFSGKSQRAGQVLSGTIHLALAYLALRLALASGGSQTGGNTAQSVASLPGGTLMLAVAGLLMIVGGLGNFLEARAAKFRRMLGGSAPRSAEWAGRIGYAARGAVFVLIGWQLISAALGGGERQPGTESALDQISGREWLFYCVAVGLLLFGAFNLVLAIYARIQDENVIARLRAATSGHHSG